MKKRKELEIKNLYLGDILKCVTINKIKDKTVYMNAVLEKKKIYLLEVSPNTYITLEDYVKGSNTLLGKEPTHEFDIFVDENSLQLVENTDLANENCLHL